MEIFYQGQWGTLCDNNWDVSHAEVVCKQVGCGPALVFQTSGRFGKGSGPVWMNDIVCSGSESSLVHCSHRGFGPHTCDHRHDAGVVCETGASLRLVNGYPGNPCSGRVELYHRGQWGTVCDYNWDMNHAQMLCELLRCGDALSVKTNAFFGQGTGPVWMDNIGCTGKESSQIHCRGGTHKCDHSRDAGVVCDNRIG